ncbi:MAG TPA: hypothetical protein VK952_06250 [Methylotenera sp.]|nr:hypothetical protein [Methylotenera sp.]
MLILTCRLGASLSLGFCNCVRCQTRTRHLYSIVARSIGSLFGGSRLQVSGPTSASIVILAGVTAKYGVNGLQIATIMAEFLAYHGLVRFGGVIKEFYFAAV